LIARRSLNFSSPKGGKRGKRKELYRRLDEKKGGVGKRGPNSSLEAKEREVRKTQRKAFSTGRLGDIKHEVREVRRSSKT